MRVIIADDEVLSRQKLRLMLGSEPGIQIMAECRDGAETVRALTLHHPDLLMLDIQMPDLDGFEILSGIPVEKMPMVIFTTAYSEHAVESFELDAIDCSAAPLGLEGLDNGIFPGAHAPGY